MRRFLYAVALWCAAAIAGQGWAATLGRAEVNSFLGQPLDVVIPLHGLDPGQQDDLRIRVADQDQFERLDIAYSNFLTRLEFQISQRRDRWVVRVSSDAPVNEPFLDFPVQMTWPGGRLIKQFTVLLDPPTRVQTAQVRRPEPTAARVATPTRVAGSDAQYGPVKRGETLWPIAQKLKPAGITTKQMAMALLRANPDAFIDQNVNRLRAGAVLQVPPRAFIEELDAAAASAEFAAQTRRWQKPVSTSPRTVNVERGTPAVAAAEAPTAAPDPSAAEATSPEPRVEATQVDAMDDDKLKIVAKDPAAVTSDSDEAALQRQLLVTMEEIESNRITTEALESRLERLEQEIARMEALVRLKDEQISALQSELTDAPAQPVPDTALATAGEGGQTAGAVVEPEAKTAPSSESAPAQTTTTAPAPTTAVTVDAAPPVAQADDAEPDWLRQTPWVIWVALGVLGSIVIVLLLQRRTSEVVEDDDDLPTFFREDGRAFATASASISEAELADLGVPAAKPAPVPEPEPEPEPEITVSQTDVLADDWQPGETLIEPQQPAKDPSTAKPSEAQTPESATDYAPGETLQLDLTSRPNDAPISEQDLASWAAELEVDGSPDTPLSANDEQLPVDADIPSLLEELDDGLKATETQDVAAKPSAGVEFEPLDNPDDDTFAMSLDLARAYLEIGDNEGARDMLEQALAGARDPEHRRQIEELLAKV